ncbi:tetratricopeptide repeat protein, partial [bacterium]|nr:tetratricopeptide repeat protein [bacterium]
DMGDKPGALEAIREAVEIRRRLSESNPVAFEPDLAMSLNNLSNRLSDMGDKPGALEAIREAQQIEKKVWSRE